MAKIFVTGAAGLLGSHVVRELLRQKYGVKVLVLPQSPSLTLEGLELEKIEGNLLVPAHFLSALEGCQALIHIAAITDLKASVDTTWEINFEAVKPLFNACQTYGIKRFIFIISASSFQFGSLKEPGDETCPFPLAYEEIAYMESKYQAYQWVLSQLPQNSTEAIFLAPTFMLGKYDARPSSGELIKQYLKHPWPFVPSGGRNFVYVEDVAKAVVNSLTQGRHGESYILGGENLSYLAFFSLVAQIEGIPLPYGILPDWSLKGLGKLGDLLNPLGLHLPDTSLAQMACLHTYYHSAKAIKELNMPQTSIRTAIEEAIESLKFYGHLAH